MWIIMTTTFFFLLLFVYALIEPRWVKQRSIDFYDNSIPVSFDGIRIIFLTDIHFNLYFSGKRLEQLVDQVNSMQPDIILLGGDYVDMSPRYIPRCFMKLGKLQAGLGKFGVLGNHDYEEGAAAVREWMEKAGITRLENNGVWLLRKKERIRIGGIADMREAVPDLRPVLSDVSDKDFVLLLSHNPDYVETMDTHKVKLVLSGHTHGGQVTLFDWWAPATSSEYGQKYRHGLVTGSRTKVLVSRGIGTVTMPIRFFARPEIWTITLRQGPMRQ